MVKVAVHSAPKKQQPFSVSNNLTDKWLDHKRPPDVVKVFLKHYHMEELEERISHMEKAAIEFQRRWKGILERPDGCTSRRSSRP